MGIFARNVDGDMGAAKQKTGYSPLGRPKAIESAIAFHRAGYLAEAERCYQEILTRRPDQFEALHFLGMLQAQSGRPDEALTLLSRAVRANPKSTEAHINHGNALHTLGRYEEALASAGRALAIDPHSALAQHNRGNALLALGRFDDAAKSFTKVAANASTSPTKSAPPV